MNRKIKVLYLVHNSDCDGAGLCMLNILDSIQVWGVEPHVIIPEQGFLSDELKKRQIAFTIIPHRYYVYPPATCLSEYLLYIPQLLYSFLKNRIAIFRICNLIKKIHPDIFHSNTGVSHVGYYAARKSGIPHVWHIREYQDLDFGLRPYPSKEKFIELLKEPSNTVIAITKGIAKHFLVENASYVVYDGVRSLSDLTAKADVRRPDTFLFVGQVSHNKGVTDLLQVWKKFKEEDKKYKLKIAGTTTDKQYLQWIQEYVAHNGLTSSVELLGQRNDIDRLMQNAAALIVPSYFEGFGRITAEAMLNYCPVIGRATAGTAEILAKKQLGFLFQDQSSLLNTLKEFSQGKYHAFLPIMLAEARCEAEKNYLQEKNSSEIYKIYLKIVSEDDTN